MSSRGATRSGLRKTLLLGLVCSCLLLLLVIGSIGNFTPQIYHVQAITYGNLTLTRSGDILNLSSAGKYEVMIGAPTGTAGYGDTRHWNFTNLETSEMMLQKINWWFRTNNTGTGSDKGAKMSYSNATFTDSIGSGIKLNMTFDDVYIAGDPVYGCDMQMIFKFYEDWFTIEYIMVNNYDDKPRRLQSPEVITTTGNAKNLRVGAGATTRYCGIGASGNAEKWVNQTGFGRTPVFFYNTASDRGLLIAFLEFNWDWIVVRQAYDGGSDPPTWIKAYGGRDYPDEFKDIVYGESWSMGTLWVQASGRQMDDAVEDYAIALTKLYSPRSTLTAYETGWNSWSSYGSPNSYYLYEDNITDTVDYLKAHPELDVDVIVLDDSYQSDYGNWTEVHATWGSNDLEWIANYITTNGFKPGIWFAPWLIDEWVLNNATMKTWLTNSSTTSFLNGTSVRGTTYYVLNPTIQDARDWLGDQFDELVTWGFTYFKLDFLVSSIACLQQQTGGYTRGEWLEYCMNISEALPNSVYVLELGTQPYGTLQPYFAQRYADAVRFGVDQTNMDWTYTVNAYKDYHSVAPYFNYLEVNLDPDMISDTALYGDTKTDAEYRFQLVARGISKILTISDNFDTANTTKLDILQKFYPFKTANWTQRDYWQNTGVPRTWLSEGITFLGNTYYYLAVLNPTASSDSWTLDFTTNLALPSATYMVFDQFNNTCIGTRTQSNSLTITLPAKDAKIYILLNQDTINPTILASTTNYHIISNKLGSTSYCDNKLTFIVTADSGTTSTTKVYCGANGEPIAIYPANGTLTWSYDASTTILTLNVTHTSPTRILVYWKFPGDIDSDGDVDVEDLYIIATSYGSHVGEPTYNYDSDINGDGDIDADDLHIFAGNYGKTTP